MSAEEKKLIYFSSLSAWVAWYDFYLCGVLAATIGKQFFPTLAPSAQYIAALLVFAAGFLVRPLGAIFFDHLSRVIGAKHTFLVTTLLMGLATFLMGCLPNFAALGVMAPILLIVLRVLQGLALGGEYGGAATYIAEHAPEHKRGAYSTWIQMTATLGFMLSLMAVLLTRQMPIGDFDEWGWRVPFWLSLLLLLLTAWIRLSLRDVPTFQKMKSEALSARTSTWHSLRSSKDVKLMFLVLLGLTAGQAVVWYTGQFYALFFLTTIAKVDSVTANLLVAAALIVGIPLFIIFGALSDRLGHKNMILTGCFIAAMSYIAAFPMLLEASNPALAKAHKTARVTLIADPASCGQQNLSACNAAQRQLSQNFIPYQFVPSAPGTVTLVKMGSKEVVAPFFWVEADHASPFKLDLYALAKEKGLLIRADPASMNLPATLSILVFLVGLVAMVYAPMAAALVALFPARMRYTGMNLPYHIGNGWFGGLLPPIMFALVAYSGDIYGGLWYPAVVALVTGVVGFWFLPRESTEGLSQPLVSAGRNIAPTK